MMGARRILEPVKKKRRRRCRCCQQLFTRDPRARSQQYCFESKCRSASKKASQGRWLRKPENQDYFRGAQHVGRVQAWRVAQAKYAQKGALRGQPLQEMIMVQPIDGHEETAKLALQEMSRRQVIDAADGNGVLATKALQDLM